MVAILAEPTLILVFVGITLLAKTMLPFAAFFILLLVETDRMPIHSSTHIEVYMIEAGRIRAHRRSEAA